MRRFFIIVILLLPLGLWAQQGVKARVAGLESNAEYMSMLQQENALKIKEDSLTRSVASIRAKFRDNPELRSQYSTQILELEGEIFDVRNQIGIAASEISSIEQEFVINNIDKHIDPYQITPSQSETQFVAPLWQSPNFIRNTYIRDNLGENDYTTLFTSQEKEQSITNYIQIYRNNHTTIAKLANAYSAVSDRIAGDSIYSKYRLLNAINSKVTDSIASILGYVYDNKSYVYNYLIDKMNRSDLLTQIEQKLLNLRQKEAEMRGMYASDVIAAYPLRKMFLLNYELRLSDILGLNQAADSLKKVIAQIDSTNFNLPKVELKERFFIDYYNAEILLPSRYTTRTPIPHCEVYARGVIYRIQVGSYTKLQSPSIFRGAYPLGYIKSEDGKYNYYAGGYATLSLAQQGVETLRRGGFKTPTIVMWENGVIKDSDTTPSSQTADGDTQSIFTVEIITQGEDMSHDIKDAIAYIAADKEIARMANKFIIGSFSSRSEAEKVAEHIKAVNSSVSVIISSITL